MSEKTSRAMLFKNAMLLAILLVCFVVFSVLMSISTKMDMVMTNVDKMKGSHETIVEMGKVIKELNSRFELDSGKNLNKEGNTQWK